MRDCIKQALDWVPELKHEGLICTYLSASLRQQGVDSTREVTVKHRRYDIKVNGQHVEAKYHVEGDLHEVIESFAPSTNFSYNSKGWNSASKAVHDELRRGDSSWFLWLIAVRDLRSEQPYIYPRLIEKFYKQTNSKSLSQAIAATSSLLDDEVLAAFQTRLQATVYKLPAVRGKHTALVSRLYRLVP
ncbi:hypothetical protein [Pseudorhodoferax sp. Leaf267]|uniref:hypothetical protein n=1 Tax=Pseudorhodoferax sp. Leaf267 TaxID=1736316 RepID=UPI0012E2A676|nr:hypothetical protein [Pseudorhodoferax sp. Leaf267]